jgi:O-antigen/teichoic acid export membrane protein
MYILSWTYIKEKWANEGFQKYFKNTGWMLTSRVLSMTVSLLTTIYVARNLGPTNYGQLSYAISFVGIFGFIATLGIDNVLYRELINKPYKKKEYLGSAIIIKFFAGLVAMFLTIAFGYYFGQDDVSKILILILSGTFIFNSFQIIGFEFQAQVKSKYPSIIGLIVAIILNVLKVLVVFLNRGVIYLALVLLLEPILYSIFYWFAYEKKIEGKVSELVFNKQAAKTLLLDSWPIIFTSAFALVYGRIDQVLIKNMVDAHAVGIYSSAVTIAEAWYFLPVLITSSLFPAIINAKKTSEEIYYARLKKLALFLTGIAVSVSLCVTIAAPFIMKIIYGSAFINGSIILKIYVWACVGTSLIYLTNNYLVAENNKKGLIILTFVPMALNIVLNLLWIPKYGIVGSAYATLISYSLAPISILVFKNDRQKIKKYFINNIN